MEKRTLISILTWNDHDETIACLRSLENNLPSGSRVLVIDNGSDVPFDPSDMSGAMELEHVRLDENRGFAGGQNVGIQYAINHGFDYVWLLNNDCIVPSGTLEALICALEGNEMVGAVSPMIRRDNSNGPILFQGAWFDWSVLETYFSKSSEEAVLLQTKQPNSVFLSGAALLFKIEAIRNAGLLDERYFAYFEDNEISHRLSCKGWLNRICFDACVIHNTHSEWLTHKPYYHYLMSRNGYIFYLENTPNEYRKGLSRRLIARTIRVAAELNAFGNKASAHAALQGIGDALKKKYGAYVPDNRLTLINRLVLWHPYFLATAIEFGVVGVLKKIWGMSKSALTAGVRRIKGLSKN